MSVSSNLYSSYRGFRRLLERVPFFRRMILYTVELKKSLLDGSARDQAAFEKLFASQEDPFRFDDELEHLRFRRAMEMIEGASNGAKFAKALEIGCAEGMFTEMMAGLCESVRALDFSSLALDRAKHRCKNHSNISYGVWDVRKDAIEGTYDLIVVTGVLEYIFRPSTLKRTCDKIVRALRPGGILLVGNTVTDTGIEQTWIGKRLLRGTVINDYMARDPRLDTLSRSLDQCICPFEHILFRRRAS